MFRDQTNNENTINCFQLLHKLHPATTTQETKYRDLLFRRLQYHYHVYVENFTNEKLNVIMQAAWLANYYTNDTWVYKYSHI